MALVLGLGASAKAQAPTLFARKAPAKDLFGYYQFDGLDAHEAAWKGSATYKILNETPFGVLAEDLTVKLIDLASSRSGRKVPISGVAVVRELKAVAKSGLSVAANGNPQDPRLTVTIRGGASPSFLGLITMLGQTENGPGWTVSMKKNRQVTVTGPGPKAAALIVDQKDLVVCSVANLDATLALLDGQEPDATKHPVIVELAKVQGTFHPIGFAFLDPKMLPPMPAEMAMMGLGGVQRVDYRFGFDQDASASIFRVLAPSPRLGLLGLIDGPVFDKKALSPLPANATGFGILSLSPSQVYDKVVAVGKASDPNFAKVHEVFEEQSKAILGSTIREGLVARLGPKMSVLVAPGNAGGLPANFIMVAEIRQPEGLSTTLAKIFEIANPAMKGPNPNAPAVQFRKIEARGKVAGFEVVIPPQMAQPGPAQMVKPTIFIGQKYLVIGTTLEGALSSLEAVEKGQAWKPSDPAFVRAIDLLPPNLVAVSVSDPRDVLPNLVASLPALLAAANQMMPPVQGQPAIPFAIDPANIPDASAMQTRMFPVTTAVTVDAKGISIITRESMPSLSSPAVPAVLVALLLPAVQSAREAARRAQCVNNLKQMGLAFHNMHSVNDAFPAYAIADKEGKPLLSWRVAILPFLEQNELYNKFKLDEPWDSPTNKPLLKEMPRVFACPSRPAVDPTLTHYRVWIGKETAFDGVQGRPIQNFLDGTSNTLLVAEADEAVPWTKPEGMPFDLKMIMDKALAAEKPQFGAGSMHPGGFNALFADGSVRFLKKTINRSVLGALITPASGEVINADAY